jgi:MFS family permease
LLTPLAAVLVDRHRRDRILVAVCVIRAGALAGAALTVGLVSSPLPAYAFAAVATLAHTLYRPAHSALLPSICVAPRELASANVVRGLLDSLSALVGPLAAGLLVGPFGISGIFTACGGASLWSAWLIARLDYEAPPRIVEEAPAHPAREAIKGLAIMRRRPDIRLLSVLFCLQTFTRGCFAVFSVVIALQLLGIGEAGVGVLTAAFGAGAVFGSFAASLLVGSGGFARWFAAGVAGWGIPFVALAAVSSEGPTLVLLGVVGVANAIIDVTGFTLLQRLVPDEIMGRFFAGLESLFTLSVAAGSIAAAGLIGLLGVRGGLVASGLIAPLGAVLAWPRLRRIERAGHGRDERDHAGRGRRRLLRDRRRSRRGAGGRGNRRVSRPRGVLWRDRGAETAQSNLHDSRGCPARAAPLHRPSLRPRGHRLHTEPGGGQRTGGGTPRRRPGRADVAPAVATCASSCSGRCTCPWRSCGRTWPGTSSCPSSSAAPCKRPWPGARASAWWWSSPR